MSASHLTVKVRVRQAWWSKAFLWIACRVLRFMPWVPNPGGVLRFVARTAMIGITITPIVPRGKV